MIEPLAKKRLFSCAVTATNRKSDHDQYGRSRDRV